MAEFGQYEKAKQDFIANGKAQLAKAITNKGVSTLDNASFQVLKNNIDQIKTGPDLSGGLKQWLMTNGTKLSVSNKGWNTVNVPNSAIVLVNFDPSSANFYIILDRNQSTKQFDPQTYDFTAYFTFQNRGPEKQFQVRRIVDSQETNTLGVYLYGTNLCNIYYIN